MNVNKLTWCLPVAVLSALPVAGLAENKVRISPRYSAGDVCYVEISEEVEQHQRGGRFGEDGRTGRSTSVQTCRRTVEPAADGVRLVYTFDRLMRDGRGVMGPVRFDTDADQPDASDGLGSMFGVMLGRSMTVEVDGAGKIAGFSGMRAIADEVEERAADMFLFAAYQDMLTDAAARFSWCDSLAAIHPDKPVALDDFWRRTVVRDDLYLGRLEYSYDNMVYAMEKVDGRDVVTVVYRAAIVRVPGSAPPARRFGTLQKDVSGSLRGTARFDVGRGEFVEREEKIDLSIRGVMDGKTPGSTDTTQTTRKIHRTVRLLSEGQRRAQRAQHQAHRRDEVQEDKPDAP